MEGRKPALQEPAHLKWHWDNTLTSRIRLLAALLANCRRHCRAWNLSAAPKMDKVILRLARHLFKKVDANPIVTLVAYLAMILTIVLLHVKSEPVGKSRPSCKLKQCPTVRDVSNNTMQRRVSGQESNRTPEPFSARMLALVAW
jgi:hypothetical protein